MKAFYIHSSATPPDMDIGFKEINDWHSDKGWGVKTHRGFISCGYHYIIRRDGTIEKGRPDSVQGAHVKGHNSKTLGICLVGGINNNFESEDNYTVAQYNSLKTLLVILKLQYPEVEDISGHRDKDATSCPNFDYDKWLALNNLEI